MGHSVALATNVSAVIGDLDVRNLGLSDFLIMGVAELKPKSVVRARTRNVMKYMLASVERSAWMGLLREAMVEAGPVC